MSAETPPSTAARTGVRRHDLDWIRVLAFYLLIVFHAAIGFVDWRVYGFQNDQLAGPWLELVLDFIHQWRLPVLFMISGMGTSFAFRRRTGGQFVGERSRRLLIPLVFGMMVINLPIILVAVSIIDPRANYGEIVRGWLLEFGWLGGASHLWFLVNLFIYSLVATPLFVYIRNRPDGGVVRAMRSLIRAGDGWGLLLLVPLPLIAVELLIKPFLFGVVGQGYESYWYLVFFLAGYGLLQAGDTYWEVLARSRYRALGMAVIATLILFGLRALADSIEPGYGILVINGGWVGAGDVFLNPVTASASVTHALNSWAWCMTVFAWGAKYLARPHRWLAYLNQSVYPFYLVHMSLVFVGLAVVRSWRLWWPVELVMLIVFVFAGCWLVFEVVKRTALTRALFGIKPLVRKPDPSKAAVS